MEKYEEAEHQAAYERTFQHQKNWQTLTTQGSMLDLFRAAMDYVIAYVNDENNLVDATCLDSAMSLLEYGEERAASQQHALALLQEMVASFSTLHTDHSLRSDIDLFYPRMRAILIEQGYLRDDEREVL